MLIVSKCIDFIYNPSVCRHNETGPSTDQHFVEYRKSISRGAESMVPNFSSVAPSSEELWVCKEFYQSALLYSMVFGQKRMELILANKDTNGKGISRGAEWCKFQLRSTFQ